MRERGREEGEQGEVGERDGATTRGKSGAEGGSTDGQTIASSAMDKRQSDCDLRYLSLLYLWRQLTQVSQIVGGSKGVCATDLQLMYSLELRA